jgi:hypothetical protein
MIEKKYSCRKRIYESERILRAKRERVACAVWVAIAIIGAMGVAKLAVDQMRPDTTCERVGVGKFVEYGENN